MTYFLYLLLPMGLGAFAQWKVKRAYKEGSQIPCARGISGRDTAQAILDAKGVEGVGIEMVQGVMSDHYDPRAKMLRLSPDVHNGSSLSAVGIAAHEVGHALQDSTSYGALRLRNGIVPFASKGSQFAMVLIMAGAFMQNRALLLGGAGLMSLNVIFQLVNLPVEFNASSRAKSILLEQGIITQEEHKTVDKVLDAAALTYVAATITSIATVVYYLARAGVFSGSSND